MSDLKAPRAPQRPQVREHHGDRVVDPYAWMSDLGDPEVLAYLEAENAYAEERTAALTPLREQLFTELTMRTPLADASVPVGSGPWWYYSRISPEQQYPVMARAPRQALDPIPTLDPGAGLPGEQVLLDGNVLAGEGDFFSLGGFALSHDHMRLLYAVDLIGHERFDVSVIDLASGDLLDDGLRGIGYGACFSLDGASVYYPRVDEAWRAHEIWRHRVGGDPAQDELLLEEGDARFSVGVASSRDDRHIIVMAGSKNTSQVWLLDSADPDARLRPVAERVEGVEYEIEPAGDHLLIVHNRDQPDSDLAWAPVDCSSSSQWVNLAQAQPGERFLGVDAFSSGAALSLRSGGAPTVRWLARTEIDSGVHYLPGIDLGSGELSAVSLDDNPAFEATSLRLSQESWVAPACTIAHDLATGERTLLRQREVLGGVDLANYRALRLWARADDGIEIPISVIAHRDVQLDGSNPGWITGYGAYEVSSDPYFSIRRLSLLDRGVVYAVAHVRGGGELGRAWYEQGRMEHKENTFTDFIACSRALVDSGWVTPGRLVAEGGSAGGLLIGAITHLAPELYAAVHAQVPFVDPLTTILQPELPLTVAEWEEWGNPLTDPVAYHRMKGYSPYENVSAQQYPTVLATTSLNDTRVFATEPAKWVARLRESATNDPGRHPILLRTEMVAGHGGASGRFDAWRQVAWEDAVLLDALGLS